MNRKLPSEQIDRLQCHSFPCQYRFMGLRILWIVSPYNENTGNSGFLPRTLRGKKISLHDWFLLGFYDFECFLNYDLYVIGGGIYLLKIFPTFLILVC